MNPIHWPLEVLSKAIHYKNLTGASQHVGLSQPQLSRLISQLENELGLTLLDRTSRRSSQWTPLARQLAEAFQDSHSRLQRSIQELRVASEPKSLQVATLEGLMPLATSFAQRLFQFSTVVQVQLDVLDMDELEAAFLAQDVDLIFSSRVPGRRKPKFLKELGGQGFVTYESGDCHIMSPFEFAQKSERFKDGQRVLTSNSLALRQEWLKRFGGTGQIPGPVEMRKKSHHKPVIAVAQDTLNVQIWELLDHR